MNLDSLIDLLCLPQTYPHPVEVITTIETHISVVFLTGEFAYKLKKPVDFGFLDFTDLAARRHFCEQELRLNRRTAPALYLEVVALYLNADQQLTFDSAQAGQSEPVEYLLKMRQFDPNRVLGRYLNEHPVSESQEQRLAERIAELHLHASPVARDSHLGEPQTILQPMLDNFPTLFEHCRGDFKPRLQRLLAWTEHEFMRLRPLILARKANGFVRECHGDLHLDNIALIDDEPTLFDGIEFNDEFRWIDVISDLAFLLIDLDYRQQQVLGRRILNRYLSLTGDYDGLELLGFYQVYRALVRAKISALRLQQLDENSLEFQHYREKTLTYIEQAEGYAFSTHTPALIVLQGVSGSGKSFFARQLLTLENAIVISSDIERKRLFGIAPTQRVSDTDKSRLYSQEMNSQTYQRLATLAKRLLQLQRSVIVDATFLKAEHRQPFYALAKAHHLPAYLIYLQTAASTAKAAITKRMARNDNPSDADVEVMQRQLALLEAPGANEPALCLQTSALRQEFPAEALQEFLKRPIL